MGWLTAFHTHHDHGSDASGFDGTSTRRVSHALRPSWSATT